MAGILDQLGIDQTFFTQLGVFVVVFFLLSKLYFRPFLRLFQARHDRTVADQQAAEKMILEADKKFEEYKTRLSDERAKAKREYDIIIDQARKEEAALLAHAREEAKKITHEAAESAAQQHELLRKQLEKDVGVLAQSVSETLLSRKV